MLRQASTSAARSLGTAAATAASPSKLSRCFSVSIPRITERRAGEGGPGGRASDAAVKIAIFGATGFLGRYVCCELGTNGVLAYIANRGDEFEIRHLRTSFDLGRTRFVYYSPRDKESMKEVIADADIVINMIGKYYESMSPVQTKTFPYVGYQTNYSFADANVEIPRTIAEICLEHQVDNFIHVSSAAASPDSASEWARTKYEGEQAIKEIYPWATILRPTQLFGNEDKLLNNFANFANRSPFVPLIDGGRALTQPVYAPDVAETISRICDHPEKFEGKQVDCFGPTDYTYAELAAFVYDITQQKTIVSDMPKDVVKLMAKAMQYERNPLLTPDMVELWAQDYLPTLSPEEYANQSDILTMDSVGVKATPVEKMAFNYLHRFRKGGHFTTVEGYH
eukprot:CAMPEP_0202458898 /NCGR_PEP_ID=MMETSP1360-20130828/28665_1 /ASSEMBLY_ACC=CAM_ASM_000848 /TAXON_ID=515479 /ORGANISM="Licmophora paradoxa, Strain CCMP2313" /LENGTH=395 /DNA_ID=CAMNT_0049079655 /DNA_START=53 /DNA_END=1240 /DNA_ORIENTATION=-